MNSHILILMMVIKNENIWVYTTSNRHTIIHINQFWSEVERNVSYYILILFIQFWLKYVLRPTSQKLKNDPFIEIIVAKFPFKTLFKSLLSVHILTSDIHKKFKPTLMFVMKPSDNYGYKPLLHKFNCIYDLISST